jgi:hypothetical protein
MLREGSRHREAWKTKQLAGRKPRRTRPPSLAESSLDALPPLPAGLVSPPEGKFPKIRAPSALSLHKIADVCRSSWHIVSSINNLLNERTVPQYDYSSSHHTSGKTDSIREP